MIDYKNEYLKLCEDINVGFTKEDIARHNIAMGKLEKILCKVKEEKDKRFLLDLLESDKEKVRGLIASHCLRLGVYTKEAKKVLRKITISKSDPILSFNAQATLELWKKGELK